MDTTHNDEIPADSMYKLQALLVVLQQIMECEDKKSTEYEYLMTKLPEGYRNSYHRLLQYGAMFILCLHCARRGREGMY